MALDFGVPNEDELALCVDTGLSPYLGWAFPRQADFYDRFLTFGDATDGREGPLAGLAAPLLEEADR